MVSFCFHLYYSIHENRLVDKLKITAIIIYNSACMQVILLHLLGLTHLFCTSSSTVPLGHWHPITYGSVQISGGGSLHVGGHAVPHSVNTWPSIGHSINKEM